MVDVVREEWVKPGFQGRFSSSEIHALIYDLKTALWLCVGDHLQGSGWKRGAAAFRAKVWGSASVWHGDGGGR